VWLSVRAGGGGARRPGFERVNTRIVRRICGRRGSRVRAGERWPQTPAHFEGISFPGPAAFHRGNRDGAPACAAPPQGGRAGRAYLFANRSTWLAFSISSRAASAVLL